ncbi:MAG: metallophosphoesterase family protein, partial [Sciscionella sp.]
MSEVFFTADTHFGHANIIDYCARPFAAVEEMNSGLIERWNSVVAPADTVWHLGDVGMGQLARFAPCVTKLNGTKHLIAGNHDTVWPGNRGAHRVQRDWLEFFDTVQAFARLRIAGQRVMLSHFPYQGDHTESDRYLDYRLPDTGAWLLHGHVHT